MFWIFCLETTCYGDVYISFCYVTSVLAVWFRFLLHDVSFLLCDIGFGYVILVSVMWCQFSAMRHQFLVCSVGFCYMMSVSAMWCRFLLCGIGFWILFATSAILSMCLWDDAWFSRVLKWMPASVRVAVWLSSGFGHAWVMLTLPVDSTDICSLMSCTCIGADESVVAEDNCDLVVSWSVSSSSTAWGASGWDAQQPTLCKWQASSSASIFRLLRCSNSSN